METTTPSGLIVVSTNTANQQEIKIGNRQQRRLNKSKGNRNRLKIAKSFIHGPNALRVR